MNQTVANIIKGYIECLDFVDKIAGLVQTATFNITNEAGVKVPKSVPISCNVTAEDCVNGLYNDLCPNSKYKTVIYFEDGGVQFNKSAGNFICGISTLKLVCWINVAKIYGELCPDGTPCTEAAAIIKKILCQLPDQPVNISPLVRFLPVVMSQDIHSSAIFSKYTYLETQSQYLLYPFDFFCLNIQTEFCICITDCPEKCI